MATKLTKHIGEGYAGGEKYDLFIDQLTDITAQKVIIDELHDDHATFITVIDDLKSLVNNIRNSLAGKGLISKPNLAIGSTNTDVANDAFDYQIAGVKYTKAAVATGTAPGDDVIPQSKYGAVALDIDSSGTITVAEAADNATGYDSAALAIAGLPAAEAAKVRMGVVTATKSDGDFTFGTTALDAANTTVDYIDEDTILESLDAAVSSSPPETLTAEKTDLIVTS